MSRRRLSVLEVEGVRNLADQRIALGGRMVLVSGSNAQGKSSLLEAIYLLATTKSFRARDPRLAVSRDRQVLRVRGELSGEGLGETVRIGLERRRGRGGSRMAVGQYEVHLADYLGQLPALVTTGESTRSIAGSPSERRRYVDRAVAAAEPVHLPDLAEYRRALAHRNELLRRQAEDAQFEPWDELLARLGQRIAERRIGQIGAWHRELGRWPELLPEAPRMSLDYRRAGGCESAEGLLEQLGRSRPTDRKNGMTTTGPHRDDLTMSIDGQSLWDYGSSGQIRAALAVTTLAQLHQVRQSRTAVEPVLLLDDVDSDLDAARLPALLEAAAQQAQVVAASSKPELPAPSGVCHLRVHEGRIEARENA